MLKNRISFLKHLNSDFQEQKFARLDLTIYKLIKKENLLVLFFKNFVRSKRLRSDILHYTCIKKLYSKTILINTCIDKRLVTYS